MEIKLSFIYLNDYLGLFHVFLALFEQIKIFRIFH